MPPPYIPPIPPIPPYLFPYIPPPNPVLPSVPPVVAVVAAVPLAPASVETLFARADAVPPAAADVGTGLDAAACSIYYSGTGGACDAEIRSSGFEAPPAGAELILLKFFSHGFGVDMFELYHNSILLL